MTAPGGPCYAARAMALKLDLGDVVFSLEARVKSLRRLRLRIRVGVPTPTTDSDRIVNPTGWTCPPGKADVIMDLAADQQVPLAVEYTDEVGNPAPAPDGATVVYTVDDASIINLTDNGDGTANAAAVGALGTANVHVEATVGDDTLTGDLQINVVAGLAERITIVPGEPTEVTPDTEPPTP